MNLRKSTTEAEILTLLEAGRLKFPPLELTQAKREQAPAAAGGRSSVDAVITLRWQSRSYRFVVEARRLWTPKAIAEAAETARRNAPLADAYPLVVVPYLSDERLRELETKKVSAIDLCGNGIVIVPDELLVLRTGLPNRFPWEGTIKNVYRKNSSIVARTFLLVPKFNSLKAVLERIRDRRGEITLATVSKVCKRLEDDLVIERFHRKPTPRGKGHAPRLESLLEDALRLLQPDKLLRLLADNYTPPAVFRTFRGKCGLRPKELRTRLAGWEDEIDMRIVLTGASSVDAYAVMAHESVQSFYCSDIEKIVANLGKDIRETDFFPNVILQETGDDFVYFDRRPVLVASPIQSYLELTQGDTRERETAEQVRRVILGPLTPAQPGGG
jgi:hypothetical protein